MLLEPPYSFRTAWVWLNLALVPAIAREVTCQGSAASDVLSRYMMHRQGLECVLLSSP